MKAIITKIKGFIRAVDIFISIVRMSFDKQFLDEWEEEERYILYGEEG